MGKNNVLKFSKNNKIYIVIFLYVLIWMFPFSFLFRDFYSFENIKNIFNPQLMRVLKFTFYQAFFSTVFSLIISFFPAFYASRRKNFIAKLLESSIFIPFFFPPISMITAFSMIYASNGFLNSVFGIDLKIMFTIKAVFLAHIFYNSPIFVKYISEALKNIPSIFIETSKIEGAGKLKTFFLIEFPLILPAISRAFFLVFTYCFTSFAVILGLGGLQFSTLEVAISNILRSSLDFPRAINYALVQFFILLIMNIMVSGIKSHEQFVEKNYYEKKVSFSFVFSILYVLFIYSIIIIGITAAFYNFYDMKFDFSGLTNLFSDSLNRRFPVIKSLFNSFIVAIVSSFVSVSFVFYLLKNYKRITSIILMSVMGISSAFLAISLLYLNILFDIPYILLVIFGYTLVSTPIAFSFLYYHITSFDKSLIEAGKIDGAGKFLIFKKIEFPLLFPVLFSTFLQIFAIMFGEFTISYTMQLRDVFPLVSIVNYSVSSNRFFKESSALSALNIIIIFSIFYFSKWFENKKRSD